LRSPEFFCFLYPIIFSDLSVSTSSSAWQGDSTSAKMLRVLALFVIAWFSHADLGFISNDDGVSGRADDLLIEVVAPAPAAEIFESEVRLVWGLPDRKFYPST